MNISQICVGNYPYAEFSFDFFVESMVRLNVHRIELWAAAPHFCIDDVNFNQVDQLKRKLASSYISVACITPEQYKYPINIASTNADERRRSIAYFKKAVDIAQTLESPRLLIASGHHLRDENRSEARKWLLDSLCEMAHGSCFKGVKVVFEAMFRDTDLIRTAAEMKQILDEVDFYPGINAMIDTDTSSRFHESPKDFLDLFGNDKFGYVHLNDGMPGGHLSVGDGCLPISRYMDELEAAGYKGDIGTEILADRYLKDPEQAIRNTLKICSSMPAFRQ